MGNRSHIRGNDGGDEELGTVGVLASVGHGQLALLGVLELEVLIGELVAIDYFRTKTGQLNDPQVAWHQPNYYLKTLSKDRLTRLATSSVALGEVTTLDHEVLDDTVESRSLITEALLTSGEGAEVLSGLGGSLSIQADHDTAKGLITVLNVEVDLVGDLGALGSGNGAAEEQHAHSEEQRHRHEQSPEVEHDGYGN